MLFRMLTAFIALQALYIWSDAMLLDLARWIPVIMFVIWVYARDIRKRVEQGTAKPAKVFRKWYQSPQIDYLYFTDWYWENRKKEKQKQD